MRFSLRVLTLACLGLLGWVGSGLTLRATTVIPPDFDQLVNESDYVIRAVVKSVTSEIQPNGTGKKIITKVALDVRTVIHGQPPATVVLEMLGGQVGDQSMVVAGAPKFKVGDEDILFVKGNGHTVSPLFAMMHGRYPILRDAATGREYVARSNLVPLQSTADVARPMNEGMKAEAKTQAAQTSSALSPEDFVQRVRSAVNPSYVPQHLN